jgi:hypothetical protein
MGVQFYLTWAVDDQIIVVIIAKLIVQPVEIV